MKRRFLLTLIVSFISIVSFSQWEEQNIFPDDNFFNDVFLLDNLNKNLLEDNIVWIVGDNGIILKSYNLGFKWLRLNSNTNENLNSIWFLPEEKGFLCGNNGVFKYSSNGGYSWQETSLAISEDLMDLFFLNEFKGWVVGENGTIFKTSDGGLTWSSQTSGTQFNLETVHFINENEGWAAGLDGVILHTVNGGINWNVQSGGLSEWIYSIHFTDENNGWAASGNVLMHTTNGGELWEVIEFTWGFYSVYFKDVNEGWLLSTDGEIKHTIDGGENWESLIQVNGNLKDMHINNEGYGIAAGTPNNIYFKLSISENWIETQLYPLLPGFADVFFLDSLNGWATGFGISHTDDGGNNWYTQTYGTYVDNIYFTNENIGYACSQYYNLILKTLNGGETWFELSYAPDKSYSSMHFFDSLNGMFACSSGEVLKTTDGFLTWTTEEYQGEFTSIFFVDNNHGWISGRQPNGNPAGLIKRTIDGGATWTDTQTYALLMDVFFINQNVGWTVGKEGHYYKTIDGGVNWEWTDTGYEETLRNVEFMDENEGWMCAGYDNIFVLHSVDGGNTWEEQCIPNEKYVYAFDFIDENNGWAVGNGVFHTNNGGTVGKKENKIISGNHFTISPNPCKDIINIDFRQPLGTEFTVQVFNMNGQIVKSTNLHSLSMTTLDVSDIPSGLYLIQIHIADKIYSEKILKQ